MALFSALGNILFPSFLLLFFIVSDVFAETYSNGHCYGIVAKSPPQVRVFGHLVPSWRCYFRRWDLDVRSGSLKGWRGDRLVRMQSSPSSSSGPSSLVPGPLQP